MIRTLTLLVAIKGVYLKFDEFLELRRAAQWVPMGNAQTQTGVSKVHTAQI